jgi:hypothetical protein
MHPPVTRGPKKRFGWIWKLIIGLVLILVVGLTIILQRMETIALNQINRLLTTHLVQGGQLAAIDMQLVSGRIQLAGLTVNPPTGHGTQPLLSLDRFVLDVDPWSLMDDTIVVEELQLNTMALSLVRNKDGNLGLDQLVAHRSATQTESTDTGDDQTTASGPTDQKKKLPVIQINRILVDDGSLVYRDLALAKEPLVFPLNAIRLQIDGLRLLADDGARDPAALSLSFKLKQPAKLPMAHFGAVARMGPIPVGGLPAVNAQARMAGLKLDTLGSLLPSATRTALGGTGLDSGVALALNDGRISLSAQALTDRNIRYDTIQVQGPLNAPRIQIAPVMSGILRVTDGVLNIGRSSLATGVSLVEGGVDTAKAAGSGVMKATKQFFKGLVDTGAGLATLDKEKVGKGLAGSTKGTIDMSMDSMKGAKNAARDGLDRSASDLTGNAAVQAWDQGIPDRHQVYMQRARTALEKMPYPPTTE